MTLRTEFRRVRQAALDIWHHERVQRWRAHPAVRAGLQALRLAAIAAVLAYLAFQLSAIGWAEVIRALPGNPAFYVLFALQYACLPLAEIFIYQICWRRPLWGHAWPFFVKRAYNFGVFDMSGEAYFGWWAHQKLGIGVRPAISAIKDVNLLSAAASNLATPVLLAWFYVDGGQGLHALGIDPQLQGVALGAVGAIAAVTLIAGAFQGRFLSTTAHEAAVITGAHTVRLGLSMVLQAWSWAVVFPSTGFSVWLAFTTAQLVISRIPFVPNRDLIFLGLSLSMAPAVQAPQAAVAGMFVMAAALTQCANFAVLGVHALINRGASAQKPPHGSGADPA